MSIHALSAVFNQFHGPPSTKLVLLALADYANDEGIVWPSLSTVAHKTCLHVATVKRILAQLGRDKILVITEKGGIYQGRNVSSRRRIDLDRLRSFGADPGGLAHGAPTGLAHGAPTVGAPCARGRRVVRQYSSLEPSDEPTPPTPSGGQGEAGASRRQAKQADSGPDNASAGASERLGTDAAWRWIAQRIAMYDVSVRRSHRKSWEAIARTIVGPEADGESSAAALREVLAEAREDAERRGWPPRRRPGDIAPSIIKKILKTRSQSA